MILEPWASDGMYGIERVDSNGAGHGYVGTTHGNTLGLWAAVRGGLEPGQFFSNWNDAKAWVDSELERLGHVLK